MHSGRPSFSGDQRPPGDQSCPRCGSAEVRRLSLIHATGLPTTARNGRHAQTALSRHAAPPTKRHAALWSSLAVVSMAVLSANLDTAATGTAVIGVVTVVSAIFALRATRYNARVYPELRQLWDRSFMCARCGGVFSD